ncbi:MAG: tRNA lysidine(34) synthetase TilS [Candidatus Aminicenantes bacterium]|nr:tRNA lysidine(34) synthetase TilS [Candidatus Aminicenantes bacterium]
MFLDKVQKTIEKHRLLEKGDKVLIACSGGPDSTALLAVLLELRELYSLRLALAHFNHMLRRSADADERFVLKAAREHALPLYLKRENIRVYACQHGLNIEEAGRERRYAFLRATAARTGATKIATGHTMTDQAETLLLRLLRGSGPRGLAGIAPLVDGLVIRPLLGIERREVEAYLKARRLSFRTDESNFDRRYLRNRIRLELIPLLEKRFEPRAVRQLSRLADILRDEEDFLETIAKAEATKAVRTEKGRVFLDVRALASLPPALARRVVRIFLARVKGDLRRIGYGDVESVRLLGENREARLPGGPALRREKERVFLKPSARQKLRWEYLWDGRKGLAVQEIGLFFSGRKRKIKPGEVPRLPFDDERRAFLDAANLRFPLLVRNRREGDRYQPLGAPGRKKLKEVMRARNVPIGERDSRPVFLSGNRIVWVPGLPVAEAFKVTRQTKEVLVIEKIAR